MFTGIHDSLLVGYSVNSETRELILSLQPHQGTAPSPFYVVFEGLVAHQFETPLLPAVLAEVIPIEPERLLRENWPSIEAGFKARGWPGPWADNFADAMDFAHESALHGFQIESSYGLSGWVLARQAKILTT